MISDTPEQFAERIWRECVKTCTWIKDGIPCHKQHGHGLEINEKKLAQMIAERDIELLKVKQ